MHMIALLHGLLCSPRHMVYAYNMSKDAHQRHHVSLQRNRTGVIFTPQLRNYHLRHDSTSPEEEAKNMGLTSVEPGRGPEIHVIIIMSCTCSIAAIQAHRASDSVATAQQVRLACDGFGGWCGCHVREVVRVPY